MKIIRRSFTRFVKDEFAAIRYDAPWQKTILKREEKIFKKWSEMTVLNWKAWKDHVMARYDPGTA